MMFRKLRPTFRAKNIYGFSWKDAYDRGIRGVILDIDNTLVPHNAPADKRCRIFVKMLKRRGFRVMILSNNKEERAESFARAVNVPYLSDAGKPWTEESYEKALKLLGLPKDEVLCVGDQVFTDIWGAGNAGLRSLLTEPLDPGTDTIWIKIKRVLEFPIKHLHNVEITSKITNDF